jgi:hypothetical protein
VQDCNTNSLLCTRRFDEIKLDPDDSNYFMQGSKLEDFVRQSTAHAASFKSRFFGLMYFLVIHLLAFAFLVFLRF